MATIIQAQHRGKHDRHQRWARLERADLLERYSKLRTQGMSQRQAAQILDVPRSTLQAWRTYQETLDACPTVVTFFHSPPGLAFLHRLVLALHVVCVEVGACGIRLYALAMVFFLKVPILAAHGAQSVCQRLVWSAAAGQPSRGRGHRAVPPTRECAPGSGDAR